MTGETLNPFVNPRSKPEDTKISDIFYIGHFYCFLFFFFLMIIQEIDEGVTIHHLI